MADPSTPKSTPGAGGDHDLERLPAPRRPWRRVTLCAMTLVALGSLALAFGLRGEALFALRAGPPLELGELSRFHGASDRVNAWVHGQASLRADGAVRYARPLESDTYRLARVEGNDTLWVQVRVPMDPSDPDGSHFVPPTSFVGRLIPVSRAGIRHAVVRASVADAGQGKVTDDAWLLIDDEEPHGTRWALGLVVMFLGFAAFNLIGLFRLTRQVA